jgi:hypothetical protein
MNRREFIASAGTAAIVPFIPRILRGSVRPAPVFAELKSSDVVWVAGTYIGALRSFGPVSKRFCPALFLYMHTDMRRSIDHNIPVCDMRYRLYGVDVSNNLMVLQDSFIMGNPSKDLEHEIMHWTPEGAIKHILSSDIVKPSMLPHLRKVCSAALRGPVHSRPCSMLKNA